MIRVQIVEDSDRAQALSLARSSDPNLALTNADPPPFKGFQLAEAVSGEARMRAIPSIFVRGQGNPAAVARAAALRALRSVTKPFGPAVLSGYAVGALERVGSSGWGVPAA